MVSRSTYLNVSCEIKQEKPNIYVNIDNEKWTFLLPRHYCISAVTQTIAEKVEKEFSVNHDAIYIDVENFADFLEDLIMSAKNEPTFSLRKSFSLRSCPTFTLKRDSFSLREAPRQEEKKYTKQEILNFLNKM